MQGLYRSKGLVPNATEQKFKLRNHRKNYSRLSNTASSIYSEKTHR